MIKPNNDALMQGILKDNPDIKLLLHACCAPCSSYCLTELAGVADVTVYFYNPNIDADEEYSLRKNEQERLIGEFNKKGANIKFLSENHEKSDFLTAVKGYENEPERGSRCEICFRLRLGKCAKTAKENGYDYFATTLTLSPLKNADLINKIGFELEKEYGVKYLPSDFKKRGGYLKSIELSKEYSLYRQNYCGCVFSKRKTD